MNRRQILGFAVGPIGAAGLSFISLPIMTWIFPPADIGKLSMLQVTISFSTLLCCLGLDQAYVREYHESKDKPKLLLNATFPGLLVLAILALVVLVVAPRAASELLYGDRSAAYTIATIAALFVAYVSRFLSLVLRMEDRGLAFSMSQILAKVLLLGIVAAYALVITRRNFLMLLAAQLIALSVAMLVFAWNTRSDWVGSLRAKFDSKEFRRLLGFGWPLVLGGVASWALAAMDRVFLRSMSTYDELAVYSVAASIASGVTLLAGVFNIIWAPMVYKWVAEKVDMERLDAIAHQVAVLVFLVVCGAGCFSWVLRLVLPHAYADVPSIVVGCMAAPLFYTLSEITGIGIAIARRTILSMASSLGAVALNVALCFVLVPRLGATGAMLSTATASWLFFVLRTELSAATWRAMPRTRLHVYAFFTLFVGGAFSATSGMPVSIAVGSCGILAAVVAWQERRRLVDIFRQFAPGGSVINHSTAT